MLKLATILDNPGAPVTKTRYRDPQELSRLGYNGIVLYETTGLSGVEINGNVADRQLHHWLSEQFDLVDQQINQACAAKLDVYLSYDVLSLSTDLVDQHRDQFCCKARPVTLCPASNEAISASVDALRSLLRRFNQVRGVVIRFGDNEAARLPHLTGNDILLPHCARCSRLGRAKRINKIITAFYDLVIRELELNLIVRAWNVRPTGMHDSVDVCRRAIRGLPRDDRFMLSFKFTQTDFWRYQHWNQASLACEDHPIIYELECQREYEGKGAIPNWQVPLWCDGPPEITQSAQKTGLNHLPDQVHLAGLWAWVRGGGWGGPFVSNETWIDANVYAVPKVADGSTNNQQQLALMWMKERLDITDCDLAETILKLLQHSHEVILNGFYIGAYAQSLPDSWHPNADWIQDDLLDAHAVWRMIEHLPASQLEQVINEKRRAADMISKDRIALKQLITESNRPTLEPMLHTLEYADALLGAIHELLAGLAAYRRHTQQQPDHPQPALADQCRHHLLEAQNKWNHHTQRTASLSGAATAFRESGFWELTQQIMNKLT